MRRSSLRKRKLIISMSHTSKNFQLRIYGPIWRKILTSIFTSKILTLMTKDHVVPTFLISLTQSILIILNKSWSMLLRRDSLLKVFKTRIKLSRQLMTGMMNYRKCRFCPVSQFLKHFLIFFQLQKNLAKPCIFLKQVPRRSTLIRRESLFLFLAQSENFISKSILRARNRIHLLQR